MAKITGDTVRFYYDDDAIVAADSFAKVLKRFGVEIEDITSEDSEEEYVEYRVKKL